MDLKSILNQVESLKTFVYKRAGLVATAGGWPEIEIDIEPQVNGQPTCSGCGPATTSFQLEGSNLSRSGTSRLSSSRRCGGLNARRVWWS